MNADQADSDLFQTQYLNLLYWLEYYIASDIANLNGMEFTLDDFCYKPITGQGCLVESAMQYYKANLTLLNEQNNPK